MYFKRVLTVLKYLIFCLALLFVLLLIGVNLPVSQRLITGKANAFFRNKNLPVQVDNISLLINGKIGLTRPRIIKETGDTIVFARQIRVSVRMFPLLLKKVTVNSVTINDAAVHITTDSTSGKPDLVSLFSPERKIPKKKGNTGKKWDISVHTVSLKNIRFTYNDQVHGIQISQYVGKLYVKFDKFSLAGKQLFAAVVNMEKAHGGIVLKTASPKTRSENKLPAAWNFKLRQSFLKDIQFTLHQPDDNSRGEFSLSRGFIEEAGMELAGRRISVSGLVLEKPGALFLSSPNPDKPATKSKNNSGADFPGAWTIMSGYLKITRGAVQTQPYLVASAHPADRSLQIAKINVTLKDLLLSRQASEFKLDGLSLLMGNGTQLIRGSMEMRSDSTRKTLLKTSVRTKSSRINLRMEVQDELAAILRSYHSVPVSLVIDDTKISAREVLAFLPDLKEQKSWKAQQDLLLGVNCRVTGTADLLKIENFSLNTPSGFTFSAAGQLTRITNPRSALCDVAFRLGEITRSEVAELMQIAGSSVNLPEFEPLTIAGNIGSKLLSPEFTLTLQSRSGNLAVTGLADLPDKRYDLKMSWDGLELGKILLIRDLGRFSGNLTVTGKEFSPDRMRIKASVNLDSAGYKGYHYHDVHIALEGDKGLLSFKLNSADPAFECDLAGTAGLHDSLKQGKISGTFSLDAGQSHLYKDISIGGALEAEMGKTSGNLDAFVSLKNIVLRKAGAVEDLKELTLSFQSSDSLVAGKIDADFVKADMHCRGSLGDIQRAFSKGRFRGFALVDSAVENRIPYLSVLPDMHIFVESTYDPFLGLLLNDSIFSYHQAMLELVKDTAGYGRVEVSLDRINFGNTRGYGTIVHIESFPDRSDLRVLADSIRYNIMVMTAIAVDLTIKPDSALYGLKAGGKNGRMLYQMAGLAYRSNGQLRLRSTLPQWTINGFEWIVSPEDFLVLEPQNKDFTADLHWKNDRRAIDIYGQRSARLNLEIRNVWFNMLAVPGMNTFGYDGELTGIIDYEGYNKKEVGIQMDIRQMKMAERLLGDLKVSGTYSSDTLGTIESDLNAVLNDTSTLDLIVRLGKHAEQKSVRAEFSGIPLDIVEPSVNKYISGLHGKISGGLTLTSIGNKPRLNGKIAINKTALKIIPLNARFYLPDEVIQLENNQMRFRQFTVLDSLNKRLSVDGFIDMNDPGNITADLQITSDRLQVMNTTEKENPAFNGSVFVNSELTITGPVQKPSIAGNIVLAEGTVINYRYTENLTVSETEKTLTFASLNRDESSSEKFMASLNTLSKAPNIEASIEINPNSLFTFQISRGYDIGVSITGGGFLNYALMPNNAINLSGTYEIQQGSAELKIPGWPRKNFIITPGSYLKWNGPVEDPELLLETTSKVRGSYYSPVDGQNREVNFLVYMKLSNKLSQLEIFFDVGSNDQYITSVFNTLSKDERMRQAINLLIFERIELPNMESSSDYVTQQINQFWESQINQFTKSAIKNVDVSFGIDTYTGASEGGGEQQYTSFTYEVKKEVFNDRGSVLVSGRMNDNSQAGAPANNMFENFIFEYALDTNKIKFLKVYRQQNYEDLLEGEVTKSGVGFIYRKSYDRLHDIWRRKKKKD